MKIHQIKIDFNVTEEIKRFVYVYLIEESCCYLIDSGVYGAEERIEAYMKGIGREVSEIKGIFLTHAHPDHIGTAAFFREKTGCKIYASEGEKQWIEDIDLQFRERPIPNFYKLAGRSVTIDVTVKDGDIFELEPGLAIECIRTAGHSADGMSYCVSSFMFIGDAVPVKNDIPIFINERAQRETLDLLEKIKGIEAFCPAWDKTYDAVLMKNRLNEARELIDTLKAAVVRRDDGCPLQELALRVCESLQMPQLMGNPLFAGTIDCLRERKV